MLEICIVRYFLFNIIYQILLYINKSQSFFNTRMEKGKPNNTRDPNLEKMEIILKQCCKEAKNNVNRITLFRQSNTKLSLLRNYSNVYANFYENHLLSRVNYRGLQFSCQKVRQIVQDLLKQIWNEKESFMKVMKSCLEEINKCSNIAKSEQQYLVVYYRGFKQEDASKTKCVQYLSLIHQSLVYQTEKLQEAQKILLEVQQSQVSNQKTIVDSNDMKKSSNLSQDQNQVLTGVKTIIEKIITETETFCKIQLPKTSFYQLKKNHWYAYLKSLCQEMLEITVNIMNYGFKFSQWFNFHNALKRIITENSEICEQIMKDKYLFGSIVKEINNHLNIIRFMFQEFDSLPNRIKKLSGINQEMWGILSSAADIKFDIYPILENAKNTEYQDCSVKKKFLMKIRERSTFIQQKTLKLLDEIGNGKKNYIKVEDTVKIQTLNTCNQQYDKLVQENKSNVEKIKYLNQQVDELNQRISQLIKERDIAKNSQYQSELKLKKHINERGQLLNQKLNRNSKQSARVNQSRQQIDDEIAKQRAQFEKEKLKSQRYFQLLQIQLVKQYEKKIKQFQDRAKKETQELSVKLISLNKRTEQNRKCYSQQYQKALKSSQHNSACLKMIYRSMKKMNEIYNKQSPQKQLVSQRNTTTQKKQTQKYLQNFGQKINSKDNQQQQVLTEEQGKHVIVYSIKTLKMLESVIQLRDQKNQTNISSKIQQDENKLLEVIKVIQEWNNTDKLGLKLKSNLKNEIKASKRQIPNPIEKLHFTFSNFVNKIAEFVQLQQKKANQKINDVDAQKNQLAKLNRDFQQQKISMKKEHTNAIQSKDYQIKEINLKLLKVQSQHNSNQKNGFQDLQKLKRQNQSLRKQNKQSQLQHVTQYNAKKQELLQLTKVKNSQNSKLSLQLQTSEQKIKDLKAALQSQKNKLKQNQQDSKQKKNSYQIELNKKDQQLNEINSKLQLNANQLEQIKTKFNTTIQQLSSYQKQSTINNQTITQLQKKLHQSVTQKQTLETTLSTTKSQYHYHLSDLSRKIDELKILLAQKQQKSSQALQQLSQFKQICMNVYSVLGKKLKKQLKITELANQIQNYNPQIGMKLIVSHIMHGNDPQRSQIIGTIEEFSKKIVKRTDLLCRYPDAKSIVFHLKNANDFAFIIMYKTVKGTIFGSYSEGFRKPTFLFSFTPSGQNKITQVKFYIPQNPSVKVPSVELFQKRYLQYGACQLRLSCTELETITAKSDVKGENYYGLNWREVMNENNQEKVPLSEVELHKVQFEVQVTNEKEQNKI